MGEGEERDGVMGGSMSILACCCREIWFIFCSWAYGRQIICGPKTI